MDPTLISWEAIATFVTGVFAVAGATYVGTKQTKIQEAQYLVSETTVRIALLERRTNCIAKMRNIYNIWMQNARLTKDEWVEFRALLLESELIFSKSLVDEIDQSIDSLFWADHWMRRSFENRGRGVDDKADEQLRKSFEEDDRAFKLMPGLLKKMQAEARVADWL